VDANDVATIIAKALGNNPALEWLGEARRRNQEFGELAFEFKTTEDWFHVVLRSDFGKSHGWRYVADEVEMGITLPGGAARNWNLVKPETPSTIHKAWIARDMDPSSITLTPREWRETWKEFKGSTHEDLSGPAFDLGSCDSLLACPAGALWVELKQVRTEDVAGKGVQADMDKLSRLHVPATRLRWDEDYIKGTVGWRANKKAKPIFKLLDQKIDYWVAAVGICDLDQGAQVAEEMRKIADDDPKWSVSEPIELEGVAFEVVAAVARLGD
jgi:hypothetical protein